MSRDSKNESARIHGAAGTRYTPETGLLERCHCSLFLACEGMRLDTLPGSMQTEQSSVLRGRSFES
jgi:hypothetical protein